jgi:glucosamine kinase
MNAPGDILLLGIDGGGSRCRARLCTISGAMLSEGTAGSANVRLGVEQSFASVHEATVQCMSGAGRNGGVIVIGTGSIGWAELNGRQYRVGGWGWPISDEGSGAWLGCEALRRALWAYDGRIAWTPLLRSLFARFRSDPHAIVAWMTDALPKDFASFAPEIIEHACANDPVAVELLWLAGGHIDALARVLVELGAGRLSLVGGLAASIEPWLADATRRHLVAPRGDALAGALQLAREAAESLCHDVAGPRHFR